MKVLFCASEVAPFEKTGGLADVAGSLPLELGKLGVEVLVTMPRYRGISLSREQLSPSVRIEFVEHEAYFNRAALYGNERGDYPDNLERFSFFCRRSLELARETGFRPDIVHAHDWQTALLPVLLRSKYRQDAFFEKARSVMTVHNLAYQGIFPHRQFGELHLDPSLYSVDGLEFYGRINLLKGGLVFADEITTVSPTYAEEIKTRDFGYGLDGVVVGRAGRLRGILNGLDLNEWDPEKDPRIAKHFSARSPEGKAVCKTALQNHCGWEADPDIPLFSIVSRLAEQKGLDLLLETLDDLLSRNAQFVLLGTGDATYHRAFHNVAARHPKRAAVFLGFSAADAHAIYAGSDFFLMPSLYEPCGLGQMISMRYGTVPVVRHTGGLADTVIDVDADPARGNGISFREKSSAKLAGALDRAMRLFPDTKRLNEVRRRGLTADFSWERSARQYHKLYKELLAA